MRARGTGCAGEGRAGARRGGLGLGARAGVRGGRNTHAWLASDRNHTDVVRAIKQSSCLQLSQWTGIPLPMFDKVVIDRAANLAPVPKLEH